MHKIQRTATLLIPILAIFAVLYTTFVLGERLAFTFADDGVWTAQAETASDAKISAIQRSFYLALWSGPILFTLLAVIFALKVLLLIRAGILFDDRIARFLRFMGVGVSGSGIADTLANLFEAKALSWTNPDGPLPIEWYFDSEPAGIILCGGGFYLIGWIMAEAGRVKDEVESFI